MKYHVVATFDVDLSEEIAKDFEQATAFVKRLVEDIACDKKIYVGCISEEAHDKWLAEEREKSAAEEWAKIERSVTKESAHTVLL